LERYELNGRAATGEGRRAAARQEVEEPVGKAPLTEA